MQFKISLTSQNNLLGFPPVLRVPDDGYKYIQFRHDFETEEWGYKPRAIKKNYKSDPPYNALPDTVFLSGNKPDDFVPLNKDWQFFWFELQMRASEYSFPDYIYRWSEITKQHVAFTDFHCWNWGHYEKDVWYNGFRDYVQDINHGAKDVAIKSLTCGGNIARVLGEDSTYYLIEALNTINPPPSIDEVWGKWYLIQWACSSTVVEVSKGVYRVLDFPQLGDYGVPTFISSTSGVNRVEKSWTKPIDNGVVFSPYI